MRKLNFKNLQIQKFIVIIFGSKPYVISYTFLLYWTVALVMSLQAWYPLYVVPALHHLYLELLNSKIIVFLSENLIPDSQEL